MILPHTQFGDIYLADFEPSVGHEYKKIRPAIVVQQIDAAKTPYVTIMPISSKLEKRGRYDIFMPKDDKNRLTKDSVIRVFHISTFDKSRIISYVGQAGSPTIRQVHGYLRRHFGL